MAQFILRFRGKGAKPTSDVAQIRRSKSVIVLDDSSPRMVLVEAPGEDVERLIGAMPDWIAVQEEGVPLPDTRLKIERRAT